MIVYLVTRAAADVVQCYLDEWAPDLKKRFAILAYEDLPQVRQLPAGTFIFSDLERLTPVQHGWALHLWETLATHDPKVSLHNHPGHALQRYDLLALLHQRGSNRFKARRASEALEYLRYPVFLRFENRHTGAITPLLSSREVLDAALGLARARSYNLSEMLVVEFCHTADAEGIFRKYGAFLVGGRIIPRHAFFGRQWMLKEPELYDERFQCEHKAYIADNPHADPLREIFRVARIDYGRIDYSLLDGRIQVWEINTNPIIMRTRHLYREASLPLQEVFAKRITEAFVALDVAGGGAP